ncbi:unnamed protein product [Mytilus coruscus]|uniref:Uncharacterized protein n=1 Tax=Mytilus coruscus TaxID=42192 RepID=A0A6J8BWE9_MYTCO|nr:unnamed protein product [Mytilus coruscus]
MAPEEPLLASSSAGSQYACATDDGCRGSSNRRWISIYTSQYSTTAAKIVTIRGKVEQQQDQPRTFNKTRFVLNVPRRLRVAHELQEPHIQEIVQNEHKEQPQIQEFTQNEPHDPHNQELAQQVVNQRVLRRSQRIINKQKIRGKSIYDTSIVVGRSFNTPDPILEESLHDKSIEDVILSTIQAQSTILLTLTAYNQRQCIQLFETTDLLSEHIGDTFLLLDARAPHTIVSVMNNVYSTWINSSIFEIHHWCVFMSAIRTNNDVENNFTTRDIRAALNSKGIKVTRQVIDYWVQQYRQGKLTDEMTSTSQRKVKILKMRTRADV